MKRMNREILVVTKHYSISHPAIEKEMEWLNEILITTEAPTNFCAAHELVNRNRITQNKRKILKAVKHSELRPFRFLIGKN
jgi:hypothetical protein